MPTRSLCPAPLLHLPDQAYTTLTVLLDHYVSHRFHSPLSSIGSSWLLKQMSSWQMTYLGCTRHLASEQQMPAILQNMCYLQGWRGLWSDTALLWMPSEEFSIGMGRDDFKVATSKSWLVILIYTEEQWHRKCKSHQDSLWKCTMVVVWHAEVLVVLCF